MPSSCFELWQALRFFDCANPGSSFQLSCLAACPRLRPRSLYLRTIHMRDRQATKCCLRAFRKFPSNVWVQVYLYRRIAQCRCSKVKKSRVEPTFFAFDNACLWLIYNKRKLKKKQAKTYAYCRILARRTRNIFGGISLRKRWDTHRDDTKSGHRLAARQRHSPLGHCLSSSQ